MPPQRRVAGYVSLAAIARLRKRVGRSSLCKQRGEVCPPMKARREVGAEPADPRPLISRLRSHLGGGHPVSLARPDLRQQLFRLHLLLQAFAQQGGGLRQVELTGPCNESAVPRHLIMFDRLASRY